MCPTRKTLKRREECDTYLTHICRHSCSGENPVMKADESPSVGWKLYLIFDLFTGFSPLQLCLQMWVRQVSYFYSLWKPQAESYILYFIFSLFPATVMFISFHLSRFSYYINIPTRKRDRRMTCGRVIQIKLLSSCRKNVQLLNKFLNLYPITYCTILKS